MPKVSLAILVLALVVLSLSGKPASADPPNPVNAPLDPAPTPLHPSAAGLARPDFSLLGQCIYVDRSQAVSVDPACGGFPLTFQIESGHDQGIETADVDINCFGGHIATFMGSRQWNLGGFSGCFGAINIMQIYSVLYYWNGDYWEPVTSWEEWCFPYPQVYCDNDQNLTLVDGLYTISNVHKFWCHFCIPTFGSTSSLFEFYNQ